MSEENVEIVEQSGPDAEARLLRAGRRDRDRLWLRKAVDSPSSCIQMRSAASRPKQHWDGYSRSPAASGCPQLAQVVLTTITVQSALCVTLFGTLPSTRRFIPLLPITSRSAPHSAASRTSTSAGSPSSERVSHSIPS